MQIFPNRFELYNSDPTTAFQKISSGEFAGVTMTSDISANYFNLMQKSDQRIEYTRDKVRAQNVVFFFQKNSILIFMFNRKLEIFKESGLIEHWKSAYKKRQRKRQRGPRQLSLYNVLAILQICASLYTIAVLVFVLEIVALRNERIRKCLDFITY